MRNNSGSTIQWVIVGSYLLRELTRGYEENGFLDNSQLPTANCQLPTANCQREQTWSWELGVEFQTRGLRSRFRSLPVKSPQGWSEPTISGASNPTL